MAALSKIDICFRLGLLLTLALAQASPTRAERLPIKTYTTADGLARDQVNRIIRDSRGFLWFCTDEGISRFDGYKFTTHGIEDGLPHRNVADILKTREGVYWVATTGGVCRFNPALPSQAYPLLENLRWPDRSATSEPRFVVYPLSGNERAQMVNALLQDRAGTVWCGSDGASTGSNRLVIRMDLLISISDCRGPNMTTPQLIQ